ncbi:MAG TPA: DNA polymerase III subunit beta [Gemmataceae bacterium]|nr:DNA polymerase III subunit beta [Gemmataceae bacterium]
MRILVERGLFLEGCRLAERVLPARTTDVSRAHVLVQAGGDTCTLHAAGAGIALRLGVPAEVEQPGQALLPARQALAILREAEADVLLLESAPGRVRVAGEDAEFDLASPDPGRLAPVEPFPGGACHRLAAEDLCRALKRTLFAAGQSTGRYCLHAILWEAEADLVRLVATDNRRLAVAEIPAEAHGEHLTPARRLLPASALGLLARLAAGQEGTVSVLFGVRQAFFQTGMATLKARYIEGGFPQWRKVLPGRARHVVPVVVGPFLSSARQAAAVREREGGRLVLRFEPGRVLLESRRQGAGRARVRQPLPLSGAVVEVALNPRYLIELLAALEPESTLLLGVTGPGEPVLASDGDGYRHVLVPLQAGRG